MELKDLSPTECAALVALLRKSVLSDRAVSDGETEELGMLVEELGEEAYHTAAATATERARDEPSLRALLEEVTSQEARELIYGTLLVTASTESIDSGERQLLELLEKTWNLQPQLEGFPPDDEN